MALVEVRICGADFDVGAELQALYGRSDGTLGAVASFVGLVRDRSEGAAVTALHLEHYPGMTEASIEAIISEAQERWSLLDVLVIHRVGALEASAQIVYVQVASSHRPAAFAAAEFIMDYLKTDAVFWKKESQSGSSHWVEATATDRQRRESWKADLEETSD